MPECELFRALQLRALASRGAAAPAPCAGALRALHARAPRACGARPSTSWACCEAPKSTVRASASGVCGEGFDTCGFGQASALDSCCEGGRQLTSTSLQLEGETEGILILTSLPTAETLISWLAAPSEACRNTRAPQTTLRESRIGLCLNFRKTRDFKIR